MKKISFVRSVRKIGKNALGVTLPAEVQELGLKEGQVLQFHVEIGEEEQINGNNED